MHSYPVFEMAGGDEKLDFVAARRFANLVVNGPDGPIAAHLPMILTTDPDGAPVLEGHVARSNPLGHSGARQALAVFNGPDAYVAAGFYPSKQVHGKVAPTWNYVAVQARGDISFFDDGDQLVAHLERLTTLLEADEAAPWSMDDAPAGFAEKLVTGIVGLRLSIRSLDGIRKLSQNSRPSDRQGVIDGLTKRASADDLRILQEMTRSP
ncbi:MAG: FMN-binding negative transcriptional regulator [Pseudooceanicola sp.]